MARAIVLLALVQLIASAYAREGYSMPRKTAFSGKAKKEFLKGKKEERKASGRGAGFSSIVCDWGSTATSATAPSEGDLAVEKTG